jgi:hypothetical protein
LLRRHFPVAQTNIIHVNYDEQRTNSISFEASISAEAPGLLIYQTLSRGEIYLRDAGVSLVRCLQWTPDAAKAEIGFQYSISSLSAPLIRVCIAIGHLISHPSAM